MITARGNGFTLIEIMLALGILAVAMFLLLEAHYGALSLHVGMDEEATRQHLLESVLTRAEADVMLGNLSGSGDFGEQYPDYGWSFEAAQTVEDTQTAGIPLLLYEVQATLTEPAGDTTFEFFVFNPALEEPEGQQLFGRGSIE